MFKQMAAAGGVAVGSAVGHVVGHAITGGMGGGGGAQPEQPVQQQPPQPAYQQQEPQGACAWEIKSFIQCAQQQSDLTLCEGFNEALRQCKSANGLQ